jgi:Leucine-rich repeat (LRR) protein
MLIRIAILTFLFSPSIGQIIEYTQLEDALKNAKTAQKLSLDQVKDLDISKIGNLKQLEELQVTRCGLSNLPGSFKKLENLSLLNLSDNQLSLLPKEIVEFQKLKILNINSNKFTLLPAELGELSQLQELYLSNNQLTELPENLSKLKNLHILSLTGNNFDKGLPSVIQKMQSIKVLEFTLLANMSKAFNNLTALSELQQLRLVCNYNAESLPLEITKLKSLQQIKLTATPNSFYWEKSLTFLSLLPELKVLDLSQCKLKELNASIDLLSGLEVLLLDENPLQSLPESFFRLKSIKKVSMKGNLLSDEIKERIKSVYPQVEIEF